MLKKTVILMTTALMCVSFSGSVLAADSIKEKKQDRLQDKLKDGSCNQNSMDLGTAFILSRNDNGDRKQDQLRDGSCEDDFFSNPIKQGNYLILAADQIKDRTRDQKKLKDGSCQDNWIDPTRGFNTLAADQIRDRKKLKDGSCTTDAPAMENPALMNESFILAAQRQRQPDRDKDKLKDCKGQNS